MNQITTRRGVLKGATTFALTALPFSYAVSASVAGMDFMVDAVSDIRAMIGLPVHRSPTGQPTWKQKFKADDGMSNSAEANAGRASVSTYIDRSKPGFERALNADQKYDPRLPDPITGHYNGGAVLEFRLHLLILTIGT